MIHQFEQTIKKLITFGLLTDKEQSQAIEFFTELENRIKPPSDYVKFLAEFNRITGKKYKPAPKSRELFYKQITIYSFDELVKCVENTQKNPQFRVGGNYNFKIKPEFVLTTDVLGEYLHYSGPSTNSKKSKSPENNENFNGEIEL